MARFLKRLILRVVDYVVRVVLRRVDLIRLEQKRAEESVAAHSERKASLAREAQQRAEEAAAAAEREASLAREAQRRAEEAAAAAHREREASLAREAQQRAEEAAAAAEREASLAREAEQRAEEAAAAADRERQAMLTLQKAAVDAAQKSGARSPEGWRVMRVRPFVFPARVASRASGDPTYFLVTSQGLAASVWLASSINLHPEITCSMGIDHPLISMQFYYNRAELDKRQESIEDFEPIKHGFYSETLRQHFKEKFAQHGVRLGSDLIRANPITNLQTMYDELFWFEPGSRHYGNVHVCFASQALEYLRARPATRDVTLANLIRHPLSRTEAAIKGVHKVATMNSDSDWHAGISEGLDKVVDTHAERRRDAERRFNVDFSDPRNRAVLYSYCVAIHNDSWAGEIMSVPEACHLPIERLMSDPSYFSWMLAGLTGGKITADAAYLNSLYTEAHLQSGRHTGMGQGRAREARAQYETWNDWEKFEFKQVMERLDLVNVYAPFGYDLSFVR
jgi:hypothetical protein